MFRFPLCLTGIRAPNTTRLVQGSLVTSVRQRGRPSVGRSSLRWASSRGSQYAARRNFASHNQPLDQKLQKYPGQSAFYVPLGLSAVDGTSQEREMLNTPVKQAKRGRWTELEDQEILKLLRSPSMPDREDIEAVARKLGRSVDSVERRLLHFGIRLCGFVYICSATEDD
ncbi:hypothetical protein ACJZ2D_003772 [Fusarium nematophilum]